MAFSSPLWWHFKNMNRYNIGKISQSLSFHFLASWQTELLRKIPATITSNAGPQPRARAAPGGQVLDAGPSPRPRNAQLGGLMLVLPVGILEWVELELSQMSNERFPPYLRYCRVRCLYWKVRRNDLGWGRSGAEKTGEMIPQLQKRTREAQEFHWASHKMMKWLQ